MKWIFLILLVPFKVWCADYQLVTGTLTVHGPSMTKAISSKMPRKISDDGRLVFNPGLGLFIHDNKNIYSASFVKDCFDNNAGAILYGREVYQNSYLSLSIHGGIYVREKPYFHENGQRYVLDDMTLVYSVGDYQWVPAAFVDVDVPVYKNFGVKMMFGYFINNFSMTWSF